MRNGVNGQLSTEFSVKTELRQRDTLSPMLFNIALEEVIKKVLYTDIGIKLQNQKVIKLEAYVDDIVILAKSVEHL